MASGDKMGVYGPEIASQYKQNMIDYLSPGTVMYDLDGLDLNY